MSNTQMDIAHFWCERRDFLLNYRTVHWTVLPNLPSKALHGKFGVRFKSRYNNEKSEIPKWVLRFFGARDGT